MINAMSCGFNTGHPELAESAAGEDKHDRQLPANRQGPAPVVWTLRAVGRRTLTIPRARKDCRRGPGTEENVTRGQPTRGPARLGWQLCAVARPEKRYRKAARLCQNPPPPGRFHVPCGASSANLHPGTWLGPIFRVQEAKREAFVVAWVGGGEGPREDFWDPSAICPFTRSITAQK